jgi:hypothetical protein
VVIENWRVQLQNWANQYAHEFASKPGILGVVIGGSIARGQEWRHSDLELGVLVEEKVESIPYFNVNAGRGVEVIQLTLPQLEAEIKQVDAGDITPIATWPIQLWKCRIVHDPTGILEQFKRRFDAGLFTDKVLEKRIEIQRLKIKKRLEEANQLLAQDKPVSALVEARQAINDVILAVYWAYGELPRSQNRTDSRLRALCQKHSIMPVYTLYRDVFALSDTAYVIENIWPKVRNRVLEITRLWGDSAHEFFVHAVDSEFKWGENSGILTVYRLYIPTIGGASRSLQQYLDDTNWIEQNKDLVDFLGLADIKHEIVSEFIDQIVAKALMVFGK